MNSALFALSEVGVDDVLTVDHSDHNRAGRTCPGDIGNCKGYRRAYHCERFGRNIGFDRNCLSNNHYVVEKSLREQRTQRSVDKS